MDSKFLSEFVQNAARHPSLSYSSRCGSEDLQASARGADDYLVKPFILEILLACRRHCETCCDDRAASRQRGRCSERQGRWTRPLVSRALHRSFQYHRSYTDRRWRQHQRISGAQHNACGNFWIVAKAIKVLRTMSRAADFLAARLLSIISASLRAKMKGLA